MSTKNTLQRIRTFNQDVRRLQGVEPTDTSTESKKNKDKIVLRSPAQEKAQTDRPTKPDHEIFVSSQVEPMSGLPKLISSPTDAHPTSNRNSEHSKTSDTHTADTKEDRPGLKIATPKKSSKRNQSKKHTPSIQPTRAKLQTHRKKTEDTLNETASTVTNHPESIQESGRRDVFEVGENDTTSATIVQDKKIQKKDVLGGIAESLKNWFSRFKNTYITPPKPTYTVGKAERRAGVLHSATPRTGTSLVDHDTFAERIREKYKNSFEDTVHITPQNTEPGWLPALPGDVENASGISEVSTMPRRRSHSNTTTSQTELQQDVEKLVSVTKKQTQNNAPLVTTAGDETFAIPSVTEARSIENTLQSQVEDQENPPPLPNSTPSIQTTSPEQTDSESNTTPEPEAVSPRNTSNNTTPLPTTASELATKAAEEITTQPSPTQNTTTAESEPTPDVPDTDQAANFLPPNYTGIHDREPEPNTLNSEQIRINMLSIGIVAGITGVILVLFISYPFIINIFNEDTPTETAVPTYIGTQTADINFFTTDSVAERYNLLTEQIRSNNGLIQVTPVADSESRQVVSAQDTMALLDISAPSPLYAIAQEVHFGSSASNIPFVLIRINDTKQALGAMLQWESNMAEELQPLLGYIDTQGDFVDQTISEMDIRTLQRNNGTAVVTYLVMDTMIIITTTPDTLENILPSLP